MHLSRECPDCRASLSQNQRSCICGWNSGGKIKEKPVYHCNAREYSRECRSMEELVNVGTPDNPRHLCIKHYEQVQSKSDVEINRRAKIFADAAKTAGISNYEFFKEHTGLSSPSDFVKDHREKVKQIVAQHNPLYAMQPEGELNGY